MLRHLVIILGFGLCLENIEIFPDVGVVFKENPNLVLVNGMASGTISMRLNLPTVEVSNEDTCAAMTDDKVEFKKVLGAAIQSFRTKISEELEEYMGQEFVNSLSQNPNENLDENKLVDRTSIGLDITECNLKKVQCDFFPVVEDHPSDRRYHKLIPCYDASLGRMNGTCAVNSGIGVCCSRIPALNNGNALMPQRFRKGNSGY